MKAMTLVKVLCACALLATQVLAAPVEDGSRDSSQPPSSDEGRRIEASFNENLAITANAGNNPAEAAGLFSSFNFNKVIPQFTIGNNDVLAGLKPNLGSLGNNGIAPPTNSWDWNIFGNGAANPIDKLDIGTGQIPFPSLPTLPSLPALPSIPKPEYASVSIPLPNIPKPEIGTVNIDLPVPSLPNLPSLFPSGISKPSLPSLPSLPTLPSLPSLPSFPSFSFPSLNRPNAIPGVPASQTQLLVISYPDIFSFLGNAYNSITTPLSSFFSSFASLFGTPVTGTVVTTVP